MTRPAITLRSRQILQWPWRRRTDVRAVGTPRVRALLIPTRPWVQFVYAFVVLSVLLVIIRGDVLWYNGLMNPDEAELLAEGRGAAHDLFPYREYTTSTHLFVWPMALGFLANVGVPLTLMTAHILSGLTYVTLATTGWFVMMRRMGAVNATLLVLPTAAYLFSGAGNSDFFSLSSECLPIVFLCAAVLVMLGPDSAVSTTRLIVGGVMADLAVWSKPQSAPVALAVLGAGVLVATVERRQTGSLNSDRAALVYLVKASGFALAGFVAPAIIFLCVMAAGGTLGAFVREPLAFLWNYAAHRDRMQGIAAPGLQERIGYVGGWIVSFPLAAVWAMGGVIALSAVGLSKQSLLKVMTLIAFVLPIVGSVVSLFPIYPLFPHYGAFLYAGCMFATCFAVRLVPSTPVIANGSLSSVALFLLAGGAVAMVIGPTLPSHLEQLGQQTKGVLTGQPISTPGHDLRLDDSPLRQLCPASSRVLTWGWAAELYTWYDWAPASRYVTAGWQVNDSSRRTEYRERLLAELLADPPDCIVEARGPAFLVDLTPDTALSEQVTGSQALLTSCYTTIETTTWDNRPVTAHTRRDACAR